MLATVGALTVAGGELFTAGARPRAYPAGRVAGISSPWRVAPPATNETSVGGAPRAECYRGEGAAPRVGFILEAAEGVAWGAGAGVPASCTGAGVGLTAQVGLAYLRSLDLMVGKG